MPVFTGMLSMLGCLLLTNRTGASPRRRGSIGMSQHFVYILSSKKNGTLYIGVTTDLKKRIWQHKEKVLEGFTKKYNVKNLVYYEIYEDYWEAANREKRMKTWNRQWKIDLICKDNPDWDDLYDRL